MDFSRLLTVGTVSVLALSITACSSTSSPSVSSNAQPTPIPNTDNSSADAKAKAEAEAKKKAEAEAKAKAAAKAKAEAEKAKQPERYQAHVSYPYGVIGDFDPLLKPVTDPITGKVTDPLKDKYMPLDASGMKQQTVGSYYVYSNNLSNAAAVSVTKGYRTMVGYAGHATNANELATLKGTANYMGKAWYAGHASSGKADELNVNLQANFDSRKISGQMTNGSRMITLKEALIFNDNGVIGFSGAANLNNRYDGTYDGRFMGKGAKEVAGKVVFLSAETGAAFTATKID